MSDVLETEETDEIVIEFIVEDGSCVSGANSYITLEEANQYQTNKNRTGWLALSDEEKKANLIAATQYINELYNWKGRRKYETQELAFPRVDPRNLVDGYLKDLDGFPVRNIPKKIKDAVCEAGFYAFKAKSELFSVYQSETGNLKREKKVVSGAVEKELEYFSSNESTIEYISKYAALDKILKGLYIPKNKVNVNARADWGV